MMLRRGFFGLVPAAALAACSAAPRQDYRLAPIPGVPYTGFTGQIGIRSVGIPDDLDQNEIARSSGIYQVDRFANDVWAAPLGQMLQSVMVQDLIQRLPDATVIATGGAIGAPAATLVEIDILQFNPTPAGQIALLAEVAIHAAANPGYATFNITATATPPTPDAPGAAAAMSMIWANAADRIATALATR